MSACFSILSTQINLWIHCNPIEISIWFSKQFGQMAWKFIQKRKHISQDNYEEPCWRTCHIWNQNLLLSHLNSMVVIQRQIIEPLNKSRDICMWTGPLIKSALQITTKGGLFNDWYWDYWFSIRNRKRIRIAYYTHKISYRRIKKQSMRSKKHLNLLSRKCCRIYLWTRAREEFPKHNTHKKLRLQRKIDKFEYANFFTSMHQKAPFRLTRVITSWGI